MASLVPYGSSDEDGDTPGRDGSSTGDGAVARSRHVHTSLGIARDAPQKGDWLGHVFVEVSHDELIAELKRAHQQVERQQPAGMTSTRIKQPHLSLCRPILLRKHDEEALYDIARESIASFCTGQTGSARRRASFPVSFARYIVLPSEDAPSTTFYLAAEVAMGWQELHGLSLCLDKLLQGRLQQRPYFDEARFHVSFARIDVEAGTRKAVFSAIADELNTCLGDGLRQCPAIHVDEVSVAFGKKRKKFALS